MAERRLASNVYVQRPFEQVCRLLERETVRVLQPATETAARRTGELVADLRVELGGFEIGRAVVVDAGPFGRDAVGSGRLPIAWKAANATALFPAIEGELVVTSMSDEPHPLTQITLAGWYRPPLGAVGALGDVLVGHRVAEASVRHFLEEVARRLERELSPLGVGRFMANGA
jgi:hypothetical protein